MQQSGFSWSALGLTLGLIIVTGPLIVFLQPEPRTEEGGLSKPDKSHNGEPHTSPHRFVTNSTYNFELIGKHVSRI